jgi:hypothetical protein
MVQFAAIPSPLTPGNGANQRLYFEDLSEEMKTVLRAQLLKPGDVSAVIETTTGFLLFVAREKTPETLRVAAVSVPKRGFEQWLSEQND